MYIHLHFDFEKKKKEKEKEKEWCLVVHKTGRRSSDGDNRNILNFWEQVGLLHLSSLRCFRTGLSGAAVLSHKRRIFTDVINLQLLLLFLNEKSK